MANLRLLSTSIARTSVRPVSTPSRNIKTLSSNVHTEARAAALEQEHESEVRVLSNKGLEIEQDREIEGSRTEIQRFPTNHRNRCMSITRPFYRRADLQIRQASAEYAGKQPGALGMQARFRNCEQGCGIGTHHR
jgi:hypothetical protein